MELKFKIPPPNVLVNLIIQFGAFSLIWKQFENINYADMKGQFIKMEENIASV